MSSTTLCRRVVVIVVVVVVDGSGDSESGGVNLSVFVLSSVLSSMFSWGYSLSLSGSESDSHLTGMRAKKNEEKSYILALFGQRSRDESTTIGHIRLFLIFIL